MIDSKEKEKNVNIPLSEDSHTKAKIISMLRKTKLKDYLRKIIEDSIKKDEDILKELKR